MSTDLTCSSDLIALAFAAFNAMRIVSYLPQIIAVTQNLHGAKAISLSCWLIWIGANATTALYGAINAGDTNLALISLFNAACCAIVLTVVVIKRLMLAIDGSLKSKKLMRKRAIVDCDF